MPAVDGLSMVAVVGVGDATRDDALPTSLGDETARARDARHGMTTTGSISMHKNADNQR
ncbi:MAG TPA: hypothetical protein VKM55_26675 [Candidatus Lokiarchaeia archaeon]|nr:hypothetical protein [Candidatus Lokiarchaeia archaeon]